jgi:colanic acid biosynthesis glycosyl transferase WcaI
VRVTLLNQFYAPDISPTAQMAASLAQHRAARGDEVTVITGRAGYLEGLGDGDGDGVGDRGRGADRGRGGAGTGPTAVRVRRVWTPGFGKSTALRRLLGYATYLAGSSARILAMPRQDVVIAMTTPPYVVVVALLHRLVRRRTRVVLWSMDCYPDAAERFGALPSGGGVSRVLRTLNRWAYRRLDHVVALDGAMAELLAAYGTGPGRPPVSVIPNWERAELFPSGPRPAPWDAYADLGVGDRAVIVYLGNTGVGHRFDTVLDAAAELADEALFLFVGGGARWAELRSGVARRGLANVALHGYVPKEQTRAVMAGATAALITLDDRSLGVMSPSKLHANLAAGLPVLYVGPEGSNVDEAIASFGCGTSLRSGDVAGLVAAVRSLRDPERRSATSERARTAFEAAYVDEQTLPRFDAILDAP